MSDKQHWIDCTSYSQSDPYPRVPRSWQLVMPEGSRWRIVVMTEHRWYPGQIAMYVQPAMSEVQPAKATTLEDAKNEAIQFAMAYATKQIADLNEATTRNRNYFEKLTLPTTPGSFTKGDTRAVEAGRKGQRVLRSKPTTKKGKQ